MSVIFTARMESDLSEWTAVTDSHTPDNITWSNDATAQAVAGTSGAIKVVIADTTSIYCGKTGLASTTDIVRGRVYFDPNGCTFANNTYEYFFNFLYGSNGLGGIEVRWYTGGQYVIRGYMNIDTPAVVETSNINITDAPHCIEIQITRETSDGAADGTLDIWVDDGAGSNHQALTGKDNYAKFTQLDAVRAGLVKTATATTLGTWYIDEIVVNNDGGLIGQFPFSVNVSDTITLTEEVTVSVGEAPVGDLSVNVSDSIALSEAKTVSVTPHPTLTVNVHEDIGAAESESAAVFTSTVDVHEDIGIALSFGVAIPLAEVNKSESIGHTESIGAEVSTSQVDIHEDITTGESATVALATFAYTVNVSDGVNVWEPPFYILPILEISATDNILVEETQDFDIPIGRDIFAEDTIYVIDPPFQFASDLSVSVHEDIGITESVTASIQAASSLSLNVSTNITVSSPAPGIFVYPIVELYIELDEQISTTEFVDGSYPLGIAITPDSVFAPGIRIRA